MAPSGKLLPLFLPSSLNKVIFLGGGNSWLKLSPNNTKSTIKWLFEGAVYQDSAEPPGACLRNK
jgi:hypothetical protein